MESNDAAAVCRDLAEWSQAVIADRAMDAYALFTGDIERARRLARLHGELWRLLILDEGSVAMGARRSLLVQAKRIGMTAAGVDAVDRAIVDEVLECLFSRFQSSRSLAAVQARALLLAAEGLVKLRMAA